MFLMAMAGGAAAGESGGGAAGGLLPLQFSVNGQAREARGTRLDLNPFPDQPDRLATETSPIRANADGRYRLELGRGRTLAFTYRGRFTRAADAADVDRQQHTPGLVVSQQLGNHLAASAGFQWTADIRDPDLSLHTAQDRFFTELQGRMPIFGATQVRYEFVRTDSFDGSDTREDVHRFVVKQDVVVGDLGPEFKVRLIPCAEGGIAASNSAGTAYDFESLALAARVDARSGPSLWAQVGVDWLHYYEGPDSQPGDRSDHVTRLAARIRVPLLDRFSVYTDVSWRQDVSTIADANSRTLRAGAGLELRF